MNMASAWGHCGTGTEGLGLGCRLWRHLFALRLPLVGLAMLLLADSALAAGSGVVGSFSCSAGKAVGQLYNSNVTCPTTITMETFFSFLVCNIEQLSSNLMGQMYCGMQQSLAPLVWSMATLAVLVFGISFTFGMAPMRGGEALLFLLKIAFVTGFATQAESLVGVGYNLLISGIRDGVALAVAGFTGTSGASSGNDVYKLLDGILAKFFHFVTDSMKPDKSVPATDLAAIYQSRCKNAIFAVLATLGAVFPMLSYLGLVLMGRIALTLYRAVFGYLYALVGITFLMALAPIFISFYLFKTTRSFFDKWVGYLVSLALQAILLFSFLGFILSINLNSVTSSLTNVIVYRAQGVETPTFRLPWQYCTLCEFKAYYKGTNTPIDLTQSNADILSSELRCNDTPPKPIDLDTAFAPDKNATVANVFSNLLLLVGNSLVTLIALAILVERLLAMIPSLGQRLAAGMGGNYAPSIGGATSGGGPSFGAMGESFFTDFEAGFRDRMATTPLRGGQDGRSRSMADYIGTNNGVARSVGALGEGLKSMVVGRRGVDDSGITGHLKKWLSDPTNFGQ